MWLLDTNVLSELRRRGRAHPNVAAWADALHPQDLFLSVVTILEIEAGAPTIARRDKTQGTILRAWIDNRVLTAFDGRILPVDTKIAQRCASLHVPDPRAERDALIAATALVHRLRIATRNVADFKPMGVDLFNPWEKNSPEPPVQGAV
jgi:predicted nucleic acid-binding protein